MVRDFEIPSGENLLRGFYMLPEDEKSGRGRPVVIFSHGFGSSAEYTKLYAEPLTKQGFCTVCFDFCASGKMCKSTGDSRKMSVLTQKQDLLNLVEYVKSQPFAKDRKLVLFGCSQGGLVSALAAAELGSAVDKIILIYPALVIPDHVRSGRASDAFFDRENIPETIQTFAMPLGRKYVDDAAALDVYAIIGKYRGRVLIVHGLEDDLVPVEYSRRAAKVYQNCELLEIHGDHGFFAAGFDESLRAAEKFLSE